MVIQVDNTVLEVANVEGLTIELTRILDKSLITLLVEHVVSPIELLFGRGKHHFWYFFFHLHYFHNFHNLYLLRLWAGWSDRRLGNDRGENDVFKLDQTTRLLV